MIEEQLETDDFVERLRANDSRAWNLAYEPLYRVALAVVTKTLWEKHHDAENLACAALVEFMRKFLGGKNKNHNSNPSFGDMKRMTACIAFDRTRDFNRQQKYRRPKIVVPPPGDPPPDEPTSVEPPSSEFDYEMMWSCIRKLPEIHQQLLFDRNIIGYKLKEAAKKRGINKNTAGTYYANALELVRDCLTKKGVRL